MEITGLCPLMSLICSFHFQPVCRRRMLLNSYHREILGTLERKADCERILFRSRILSRISLCKLLLSVIRYAQPQMSLIVPTPSRSIAFSVAMSSWHPLANMSSLTWLNTNQKAFPPPCSRHTLIESFYDSILQPARIPEHSLLATLCNPVRDLVPSNRPKAPNLRLSHQVSTEEALISKITRNNRRSQKRPPPPQIGPKPEYLMDQRELCRRPWA